MPSSPSDNARDPWWADAAAVLLSPLTVPLLFLFAVGSIPVALVVCIVQGLQERRFRRQMQERGRFRDWGDIEPRLIAGEGTLLIEQANTMPVRIWWAQEEVLRLAPVPPPEAEKLDVLLLQDPHPFVRWCHDRYTDPVSGQAVLTEPPFALPLGLFVAKFFRKRYPGLVAIDTVYCWEHGADPAAAADAPRE